VARLPILEFMRPLLLCEAQQAVLVPQRPKPKL